MILSSEVRAAELWRRGIANWKLYRDQRELYDSLVSFILDESTQYGEYYVDICRQFGKTFTGLLVADWFARRTPRARVLYACASRAALWQFLQPNMQTLLMDCPHELKPVWRGQENSYFYENGAIIHLCGVNGNHEDDARGPKADLIINEEAAFVDRLQYLVDSVEKPMLLTTGGRILYITTPPESPAHYIARIKAACEAKGRYIRKTLDDVTHLSDRAKTKLIDEFGGAGSSFVRREFYCEWIVERSRAILPEFAEAHRGGMLVEDRKRPRYWEPYEVMDPGYYPSTTAILFGYYDYAEAVYVIEDELILQRMRTDELAEQLRKKEAELWPDRMVTDTSSLPNRDRTRCDVKHRWSDIIPVWLNDLGQMHGIEFAQTAKDDLEAQINKTCIWLKRGKIRINPRCKSLIAQGLSGVWNKSRTDFEMTDEFGHYDALSALIYGVRNCPVYSNPYPVIDAKMLDGEHFLPPWEYERSLNEENKMERAILGELNE